MITAFTHLGKKEEAKVQVEREVLVLTWSEYPRQGYPLRDDTKGSGYKGTGWMGK